jgi:hypothetical protein
VTAWVQSLATAGIANATAGPETFTMPGNFTAGNSAVCSISHYEPASNRIASVSIGGTAATRDAQYLVGGQSLEIWRADSLAGGSANVVVTYGGGTGNYISCGCDEWTPFSGVDTATSNTATATGANASVSTAAATAQAVEVCYALMMFSDSATPAVTAPAGWVESWRNNNGTSQEPGFGSYKELSSTGTQTATWTHTSLTWFAQILAYKLGPPPRTTLGQFDGDMRISHWF